MNFSFPEDKALHFGAIKNRTKSVEQEYFSLINISDPNSNQIKIEGIDYVFTYLSPSGGNKGGNSVILKLYAAQRIDSSDPIYEDPDLILKINKFKKRPKFPDKRQKRFEREIESLLRCKDADFQNVISIENHGECSIYNFESKKVENHQFYTMEYAPFDLKSYIEGFHKSMGLDYKLNLCIELAKGLKELRHINLYHRDIKPDNIFMNALGHWKIGDLGLIDDRENDIIIDDQAEPIGPRGWMSPESMNKYLTEGKGFSQKFHCTINHQSDIFQLGKVFWYIFQHNAPIGGIKGADFLFNTGNIYPIIKTMLNYSLNKRYKDIDEVIRLLRIEQDKLLKSTG